MWTVRCLVRQRAAAADPGTGDRVFALVGEGGGHSELDAADRDAHERADLEKLETDGGAIGLGELRALEADAAQGANENVCEGGGPGSRS